LSVATGIDPATLLELDAPMIESLERALETRWTQQDELSALSLELAHAHFVAFVAAHSAKGTRLPPQLRVQRPTPEGTPQVPVLSPAAFASEFGRREVA
jgi:hypothetical protein